MDEAKRKRLEQLKKQIDPEILKRVAGSMGQAVPPGAAPEPSAPASGGKPPQAVKIPGKLGEAIPDSGNLKRKVRDRQMRELQARVRRREAEIDAKREEVKKVDAAFVIFSRAHFKAKQVLGYFSRMEFQQFNYASDPATFVKYVIGYLNDPNVIRTVIVVNAEDYKFLRELLFSEEFEGIRQKIPGLVRLPMFAILDPGKDPRTPQGLDPDWVLFMRQSANVSERKIKKALDIPIKD